METDDVALLVPSFYYKCPACGYGHTIATQFLSKEGHSFLALDLVTEGDRLSLQDTHNRKFLNEHGMPYLFQVPFTVSCKRCGTEHDTSVFISRLDEE